MAISSVVHLSKHSKVPKSTLRLASTKVLFANRRSNKLLGVTRVTKIEDISRPTTTDLAWEKNPRAQERRERRKAWKKEFREFTQLRRLALRLKVKRVIVTRDAPSDLFGRYLPDGDLESTLAKKWGLSKKQEKLILKSGPTILIWRDSVLENEACRILGHEIGHHICRLANFTPDQLGAPALDKIRRFFPGDGYLEKQNNMDEFLAECFAEYLTFDAPTKSVERYCKSVLRQVRRHNSRHAELIEKY